MKAGTLLGQAHEHEAAINFDILDDRQTLAGFALMQAGILVAVFQRNRQQRTIGLISPRVVRAAEEFAGVAACIGH